MQYITSIERIGIAKGESRILRRQLELRFGAIPAWVTEKLSSATERDLEMWSEAVLTASSLEAVFNTETSH